MPENTISGQQILFKVARDVGNLATAWVTGVTSPTIFAASGLTVDTDNFYTNGLMRKQGGSTYVRISSYTGSTKTFTVASALSPSVNDLIEFCWWNPDERSAAFDALNESVRAAFPFWYREVLTEAAASGLTLAAGDDDYSLPAACDALMAIGVGANPILWIGARAKEQENYRVEGQAGAFVLRLMRDYTRNGTLADEFNGQNIALHYATKETELTVETSTTQLPLDYFTVASSIYVRQQLNQASRLDLVIQNVNLPQIQQAAQVALQKLGLVKRVPVLLGMQEREDREINERGK